MSEAAGIPALCGQEIGISGNYVASGREPGGLDAGHELPEEVGTASDSCGVCANGASDLNHPNQYIVGLALCTLGNIASVEMSRDLFPEVETIISSANPYIRRKAALCAMRICRKVPDLHEHFLEKAKQLLQDRNHGVLLCGLTLVVNLCEADEAEGGEMGICETFRPCIPSLVKILKGLSASGYAPEHDVTGITDPFLQVKILQLLRVLARGDAHASEQINDILAQVRCEFSTASIHTDLYRLLPTQNHPRMLEIPFYTKRFSPFWTSRQTLVSAC